MACPLEGRDVEVGEAPHDVSKGAANGRGGKRWGWRERARKEGVGLASGFYREAVSFNVRLSDKRLRVTLPPQISHLFCHIILVL